MKCYCVLLLLYHGSLFSVSSSQPSVFFRSNGTGKGEGKGKCYPCARHEGIWGRVCVAPLLLNVALGDNEWLNSGSDPFTPAKQIPYPTEQRLGWPRSRSGGFRKGKNLLTLLGMETLFLGLLVRSVITILSALSRFLQ